ncbi:MAG: hypothetical protein F6J93_01320 [Oscillatoria sp. SIO1A7]|nr:hypothetical protein [Oscillatoria sp. SIO1A7]
MSEPFKITDAQTRRRSVHRLRESSRQLDILGVALDELLAMAEVELCRQRRERLEKKYQRESQKVAE